MTKRCSTGKIMVDGKCYDKEKARQEAIDYQQWASEQDLSYGELAEHQEHFVKLGKKLGLTREFRENGII